MWLSTIIPVYNTAPWLHRCVDSVLNQSLGDDEHEVVLVDDGSTDESPAICDDYAKRYPGRVRVLHLANGGVSVARNAGVGVACGEYVHFVDSDDRVLPGIYGYMKKNCPPYHNGLILWGLMQ